MFFFYLFEDPSVLFLTNRNESIKIRKQYKMFQLFKLSMILGTLVDSSDQELDEDHEVDHNDIEH